MKNELRWAVYFLAAVILGGSWILWHQEEPQLNGRSERPIGARAGAQAPQFTLNSLEGESLRLADLKQPVVVNFWASWCLPCRAEMPHLQAIHRRYNGQVAIWGINQGEDAETIRSFAFANGLTYPLLVDQASAVNQLYEVKALPTTFFITADGEITAVYYGILNEAVLEKLIAPLFEEQPDAAGH